MKKLITITVAMIFMCTTPLFAGGTPQENEADAAATYTEDNAPRAAFSRESENFAIWHTIEELLERDKMERQANRGG